MPKSTPRFMESGVDTCRLIDFPVVASGQLPQPFREWLGEANDQMLFLIAVSQMSAGRFLTLSKDRTDIWGTSSRASRRPPNVICGAAILDLRWRHRKWRQSGLWESFWSPIEAEAQNGGHSASGRHLGWPYLRNRKWGHPRWRPEAGGPPFCASASIGLQKLSLYYSRGIRNDIHMGALIYDCHHRVDTTHTILTKNGQEACNMQIQAIVGI